MKLTSFLEVGRARQIVEREDKLSEIHIKLGIYEITILT